LDADVAKEPPSLRGSPEVALDMNRASDPRPDIPKESLYTAAGWNQKGIRGQIIKDLAQKFPAKAPPAFPGILPNSLGVALLRQTKIFEIKGSCQLSKVIQDHFLLG
jgi:hypothetical protein